MEASCPVCSYPIQIQNEGQNVICSYCKSSLIAQEVSIPSGIFWGTMAFVAGVFLGPVLLGSTKSGQRWLTERAKFR